MRLDLEYIDHWSLGADLKIILKTIPAVLRGTGV
jgi:lipopolysaccharide/colanic/teichoic acid biosynthesis glycosyltransferase